MARSALPVVHLEAQEVSLGSVLLCWGASVFEGIRKHLELSLMLALTYLSVYSRSISPFETSLASTAHKEERLAVIARVKSIVPLMLERLLSRVPLPLPASKGQTFESIWSLTWNTYIRLTSSLRFMASDWTSSVEKVGYFKSLGRSGTMSSSKNV